MNNQGAKIKKQAMGVIFLIILIVITFFFYLDGYSYQEILSSLNNINYLYLLAGLGMMVLFVICEAINIYMIFAVFGQKIPFGRCIEYSCIGFYFSAITPSASGGQPAQLYYMNRDKVQLSISSIAIFYTVFVYQIAMILMGIIMFLFRQSVAIIFISKVKYLFLFGVIVNTSVIILLFLLMFSKKLVPSIVNFITKVAMKIRFFKKVDSIKDKIDSSVVLYHEKAMVLKEHPVLFFKVLFVTMIQMLAASLVPSFVSCGMGNPARYIPDLITCQSLLTISVSAIPLPGAEGVSQGGFLQTFDMFFRQNTLVSAMLINRILSFYLPLLICFIIYIYTHIRIVRQFDRGDVIEGK